MQEKRQKLIQELNTKWNNLNWPGLPPFDSELNEPACKLMELNTYVAGCVSQLIQNGHLEKRFWPVIVIDETLTLEIATTHDPKTPEFVEYKVKLDECIRLAQKILNIRESKE